MLCDSAHGVGVRSMSIGFDVWQRYSGFIRLSVSDGLYVYNSMNENEIILDSSSDESIVTEQAKKLFNICDSDEKGFINQNDLIRLNEFASVNDIQEIQKMCEESNAEQITKEHFTEII
ncbi:hypothetical protein KIN20_034963, partial [Parelaphostrongylus tenuis]